MNTLSPYPCLDHNFHARNSCNTYMYATATASVVDSRTALHCTALHCTALLCSNHQTSGMRR